MNLASTARCLFGRDGSMSRPRRFHRKRPTPSQRPHLRGNNVGATPPSRSTRRTGFTLIEVILVVVVIAIITGISLPFFSGAFKGMQLRTGTRSVARMTRYARSMAIMREEPYTVVLDHQKMEIYVGAETQQQSAETETDGKIDQDVLKRLGYVEGEGTTTAESLGISKEAFWILNDLQVRSFEKDALEDERDYDDVYLMRFYPNGQCEWFELVLEDSRGHGVKMEIDPISGKLHSEFIQ